MNDSMQTKQIFHQMGTSEIASHEDQIYFLLSLKIKMMIDFLCGLSLQLLQDLSLQDFFFPWWNWSRSWK